MTRVVGAAVVRGRRVLAAQRADPPVTAGRWELPGGKVEPGESPEVAVVRELAEELGVVGAVRGWLDGASPVTTASGDAMTLHVALARLTDGGEPRATEHSALRWLAADQLGDVDWLEPDRPFLAQLARVLAILERVRGIFFEEEHARTVVRRLRDEGYDAEVVRERLAGEDDDEDHPWAVLTDAPEMVLDLLVDAYDGWLDADDTPAAPVAPAPLDLPRAPRRPGS